jgi:hypothetical protein
MIKAIGAVPVLAFLVLAMPASAQTRLPAQLSIDNQRAATLTDLSIADADGKVIARISRGIAAGKKSVIKLGKAKGCEFAVQARFDDEGEVDETLNLCKEKVLRFRE